MIELDKVHESILIARGIPKIRTDDRGNDYLEFPDGRKQFNSIYRTMEEYRKHGLLITRERVGSE